MSKMYYMDENGIEHEVKIVLLPEWQAILAELKTLRDRLEALERLVSVTGADGSELTIADTWNVTDLSDYTPTGTPIKQIVCNYEVTQSLRNKTTGENVMIVAIHYEGNDDFTYYMSNGAVSRNIEDEYDTID